MELYFTQEVNPEDVKMKFSKVLPNGFRLLSVKKVPLTFPAIDILSNVAEYEIKDTNISQEMIDRFLSQEKILVEKTKKGGIIEIDAKPLIKSFRNENGILKLRLRFGVGKTVKPEIILHKIFRNQENYALIYAIERTELYIEIKNGEICEL
jgi:radical SAM-linked protein